MPTLPSSSGTVEHPRDIVVLRRELAQAERELREKAEREAVRLAEAERVAWRETPVELPPAGTNPTSRNCTV